MNSADSVTNINPKIIGFIRDIIFNRSCIIYQLSLVNNVSFTWKKNQSKRIYEKLEIREQFCHFVHQTFTRFTILEVLVVK